MKASDTIGLSSQDSLGGGPELTITNHEYCALLGYYAASSGQFLIDASVHVGPTLKSLVLETGPIGCPETSELPLVSA